MNLIKKCLLFFVVSGVLAEVSGQETKETYKMSITEAQDYALKNNRAVKNARLDLLSADKRIWETIAMGLPQIGFSANYQHQFVVPEISFGSYFDPNALPNGYVTNTDIINAYKPAPPVPLGVPDNTTFDLTLSQLIFSGEYIVGLQATKVFKEISVNSLAKTEAVTRETVAGTYYLYLVLGESLRVLNESLESVDKTYNDAVKMNQQGFNEDTDVDQIKISLSNLKRLIAAAEAQRDVTLKLLKYQLGMDLEESLVLTDSLSAAIMEGNIQYLATPSLIMNRV